jgi:hypothetical protein
MAQDGPAASLTVRLARTGRPQEDDVVAGGEEVELAEVEWRDPLRSVRSHRESYRPHVGREENRSDGTCETPAYAGADHQEAA